METAGRLHLAVVLPALRACALKSTLDAALVHTLDAPDIVIVEYRAVNLPHT